MCHDEEELDEESPSFSAAASAWPVGDGGVSCGAFSCVVAEGGDGSFAMASDCVDKPGPVDDDDVVASGDDARPGSSVMASTCFDELALAAAPRFLVFNHWRSASSAN